jgi:hypothetical protein
MCIRLLRTEWELAVIEATDWTPYLRLKAKLSMFRLGQTGCLMGLNRLPLPSLCQSFDFAAANSHCLGVSHSTNNAPPMAQHRWAACLGD